MEHRPLDGSGSQVVVYCHRCHNEWYHDENGLTCPRCESEITEIITPETDPRPHHDALPTPSDLGAFYNHGLRRESDVSYSEEAGVGENITNGLGRTVLISSTIGSSTPEYAFGSRRRRDSMPRGDLVDIIRDGQYPPGTLLNGVGHLRPRDTDGPQFGGPPVNDLNGYAFPPVYLPLNGRSRNVITAAPPDQIASLIESVFGPIDRPVHQENAPQGGGVGAPSVLHGLFASLSLANARGGDSVDSEEAWDVLISSLKEQHPLSHAPGPASPDAIAALTKKKLDQGLLGPEGKGECTVCMDGVHIGDEVVFLPCRHWFHETCAAAWLGEHNTCPICRESIEGDTPPHRRSSQGGQSSRNDRRLDIARSRLSRENSPSRNEVRVDSVRNIERHTIREPEGRPRWQVVGNSHRPHSGRHDLGPGGYTSSFRRTGDMAASENQRDSREGNTISSDHSRTSYRSSHSGPAIGGRRNGPMTWLRDRLGLE
ncbi:hypothetical protein B0J14DRAFT_489908 [Halenospora varia]|nr:hypothetical protein B0J14DRAFT_489908 [Halenospora varia]